MLRVYFLPVETIDGTEQVAGIEFIHDALLFCTAEPDFHKLIQNTTDVEHTGLLAAGGVSVAASQVDIDLYISQITVSSPSPDFVRATDLLSTSPAVITAPEMWELLRIIGRRFGWCD